MWGQKQSAMITEAMLSQLLLDINYKGKIVDSKITDDIFILTDGIFEHYMPEKSIRQMEKNGAKSLNIKFSRMLSDLIDKHIASFFKFCNHLQNKNLKQLPNSEIKKIVVTYHNYLIKTFAYFETSTPAGTAQLVKRIQDILKKEIKQQSLAEDYFISLSSPEELDATMQERLDFLKLVERRKVSEKDLEHHARKYPALFFNTYDRVEVINFLKNRLKEEANKNYDQEKHKIDSNLREIRKKHKEIYSTIRNKKLKDCATILQKNALDRYRLKHVWSGAEYLCLNLLKELRRRIGINFDDFIKCYLFQDIYNFLEKDIKLNTEQITDRKHCLVIHYLNKKTHYYFGKQATTYRHTLLGNQNKQLDKATSDIKGSIANKGLVQGLARVVNVKDLNQFIKDSRTFQYGEILVTTMTSPVMVPIIEKASGIITDEGGITSHAAVVSREFKIPCIVGTHGASSTIKTGDLIELDANHGIVRILKR